MATHLLVWNANRYAWRELPDTIRLFMNGVPITKQWTCGHNRRVRKGDRIFIIRLNRYPLGIFASGYVVRGAYEAFDLRAQDTGRVGKNLFTQVRFDMLADPDGQMPITRRELYSKALRRFQWEMNTSGRTLPERIAEALEERWAAYFGQSLDDNLEDDSADAAPENNTQAADTAPVPAPAPAQEPEPEPKPPATLSPEEAAQRLHEHMLTDLFDHYMSMLEAAVAGERLNRARHIGTLRQTYTALTGHEIRHYYGQVSAVLRYSGLPFIDIYTPSDAPIEPEIRRRLAQFLSQNERRLDALWLDDSAIERVIIPYEIIDVHSVWAPPPFDPNFQIKAFLGGQARFPSLGGLQAREAQRTALQDGGLAFALAFERTRLKRNQRNALAKKVRILTPNERAQGYDIASFDDNGRQRRIRVSTTQYGRHFPCLIAPRTLAASAQHDTQFYYYRVFDYCHAPSLFMVNGDLRNALQFIQAARATPAPS